MTVEEIKHLLNTARHAIFTGEALTSGTSAFTQEAYIELYEERTERNPLTEKKLFSDAILPLLPLFQNQWRKANQAAAIMDGETEEEPADFEDWLLEIYDEINSIDTEKEWDSFVQRFTGGGDKK
ncbi:hypothetical protein PP175_06640 [Aneurinibacillus sp. Ricciae_BoGa-3]|uniref:hypothetical protein n=1 Tax=Aneurinibacillus sp. Ricciae_BoGa-3 TaxID=3022697 RepID=UPI00233F8E1B|nr:hypothetical protein [Aneurinibacillus sp. Ricciae_BoGa-3]WCK55614.1 hypothetical protein PP175_06640 [Aneurinibacillus sp. Ricciae_BoGa-3]